MLVLFDLKYNQSNIFFFLFFLTLLIVYGTPTKRVEREISDRTVLEVKTQEPRSLEQPNQQLALTFQWKLNKKRCNCERMRDKDVKFIHIISIVTVVYYFLCIFHFVFIIFLFFLCIFPLCVYYFFGVDKGVALTHMYPHVR